MLRKQAITKRTVIFLMLLGIAVPFVLLTDLYPFFRFGMFAEPVRRAVQTERFVVRYLDTAGRPHEVAPAEVGLGELVYLLRNYHYRGETERLLQRLHGLHPRRAQAAEWQLLRITSPADVYRPDTSVAGRWKTERKGDRRQGDRRTETQTAGKVTCHYPLTTEQSTRTITAFPLTNDDAGFTKTR